MHFALGVVYQRGCRQFNPYPVLEPFACPQPDGSPARLNSGRAGGQWAGLMLRAQGKEPPVIPDFGGDVIGLIAQSRLLADPALNSCPLDVYLKAVAADPDTYVLSAYLIVPTREWLDTGGAEPAVTTGAILHALHELPDPATWTVLLVDCIAP